MASWCIFKINKFADIRKTRKSQRYKAAVSEGNFPFYLSIGRFKNFLKKYVYNEGTKYFKNAISKLYDVVSVQ